jgi:hypothetical protein
LNSHKRIFSVSTILLAIALISGIAAFIALGTQTRFITDDYCYAAKLNQEGFFSTQTNSYFGSVPYSGNRYALTFFVDLFDLLGIQFLPLIPMILIILFLYGLVCLSRQLISHQSTTINNSLVIFIIASVIGFTTLYLAPNQFQVIIWMNGSFTYFFPLIINIWLVYFYLVASKQTRLLHYAWLCLLSLIGAGFSEIVAVVQVILWLSILGCNFFHRKEKKEFFHRSILVFLFTCLAILILILCPNNLERQMHQGSHNSIENVITYGPIFAFDFIKITLHSFSTPIIILFGFALLIPHLFFDSPVLFSEKKDLIKPLIVLLCKISLLGFILIWVSMLPTIYALRSYPDPRGLFPATFILIVTDFAVGLSLGFALRPFLAKIKVGIIFPNLLIFCFSIYFFHATFSIYLDFPKYASRAQLWDKRHAIILTMKDKGEKRLIVPALDSFYNMVELQEYPGYWVNICAAKWYGVDSISAVEQ